MRLFEYYKTTRLDNGSYIEQYLLEKNVRYEFVSY